MDAEDSELNVVGKRFYHNGYFGTVLYKGELPDMEGMWLGVEWDDSSRGKHDGTYQGQRYFETKFPKSGSFISPQKPDFGVSYMEAVQNKYGYGKQEDGVENVYVDSRNVIKPIEVLGMEKLGKLLGQYHHLTDICIKNTRVYGASPNAHSSSLTPNVVDLDLSQNLLSSWTDVADIVKHMKNLRTLNVSENQLMLPENSENLIDSFVTVEHLTMAKMRFKWLDVENCGAMFPNLKHLFTPDNKITTVNRVHSSTFLHLESLDLESNPISSWEEILKLGSLPCLAMLNLNNCELQDLYFPEVPPSKKTDLFKSLKILRLSNNNFSNWMPVNELNKLLKLTEVRITHNPVCDSESPQTTRQLIIAKIGQLKMLNRVEIQNGERRGAEVDYLKKYGQLWLDVSKGTLEENTFAKEHPRYQELVKRYGAAEESELIKQTTNIKSKMISLNISSPTEAKSFTKKVPLSMTVQKFKCFVQRIFQIGHQDLIISYTSQETPTYEIVLDNDLRNLSFYGIRDDDKIMVKW